jgi:hypothetical protein
MQNTARVFVWPRLRTKESSGGKKKNPGQNSSLLYPPLTLLQRLRNLRAKQSLFPLPASILINGSPTTNINGSPTTDPIKIANAFPDHFFPVPPEFDSTHVNIEKEIDVYIASSPTENISMGVRSRFFFPKYRVCSRA